MLNFYADAAVLAGEVAEHTELPFPAIVYPLVIGGLLLVLMLVTVSFTNLGHRHEATQEHLDPHKQHPNKHDHGEATRR
ncbi:hypothetical protein ACX80W_14275 [Arthrobacter sp. TMN-37]